MGKSFKSIKSSILKTLNGHLELFKRLKFLTKKIIYNEIILKKSLFTKRTDQI